MADIDKALLHATLEAGKQHSLKPPIGKIEQGSALRGLCGQYIPKIVPSDQVGFYPTKWAGDQTVGFGQRGRGTTLRALVFNQKIGGLHLKGDLSFNHSQLFAALNTEKRIGEVFRAALLTFFGLRLFVGSMATPRTKLGISG